MDVMSGWAEEQIRGSGGQRDRVSGQSWMCKVITESEIREKIEAPVVIVAVMTSKFANGIHEWHN
jgi:hypothetical protein